MSDGAFSIGSGVWPGTAKLMEEMGELTQVLGKLIAMRGHPDHWDGTDLIKRMEDEIADVSAALAFFMEHNPLDNDRVVTRMEMKIAVFEQWHEDHSASTERANLPA